MSRPVLTALKIAGLVVVVVLTVTVAAAAWVVGTERGSRFALRQAEGLLPEGVSLGTASGRLADHLVLENVQVVLEGMELTVARVWLTWSPADLLDGHVEISELGASDVVYRAVPAPPPPEPTEPFVLPDRVRLPVSVDVERLIVSDIELHTAPDTAPRHVQELLVEGASFADARFEIAMLALDSPLLSVNGRLAATTAGDYPLNAHLAWRLDPAGYAPLTGTTTLGGSLAKLELDQRIGGPYHLTASGTVAGLVDPAATLAVDARITARDVALSAIQPELPPVTLSADVSASGPLHALDVDAEIRQRDRPAQLTGQGRIALAEEITADLVIRWQALQWPLSPSPTGSPESSTSAPTLTSPRGRLELAGPLDGYRLGLSTRLEPAGAPPVELELDGNGSLQAAAINVTARAGDGTLQGEVEATWDPEIRAAATLRARDLDPALLAPDWPGRLDVAVEAAVHAEGQLLELDLARLDADGRLRGQDLTASARGHYRQDADQRSVEVESLSAALGGSRVEVRGRVGQRADLSWQLESPDLSKLLPDAAGHVSGAGRVTGPVPEVHVSANLEGGDLSFRNNRLASLQVDADVDLSGESRSHLDVTARNAVIAQAPDGAAGTEAAGTRLGLFTLSLTGTPASHRLDLDLDADLGDAALTVDGRLEQPWDDTRRWQFTVTEGLLGYADLAPWRLTDSASGSLTGTEVRLDRQCWTAADARLCLEGHRDAEALAAELDLSDLAFAYFAPLLPDGFALTGGVDATVRMSQVPGDPLLAQARVSTTAGELALTRGYRGDDEQPPVIRLEPSRITVDADGEGARAAADLRLQHGRLRLQLATPAPLVPGADAAGRPPVRDQPLTGGLQVEVPDLAFLSDLVPAVEDVAGSLDGDLRIAGTVARPALDGSLDLVDGSLFAAAPGITVEALRVSLEGLGRDGVAVRASAESGDGEISVDGRLSLPGQPLTAQMYIVGREFQALDNDEGQVLVSPDLTVTADAERLSITGTVHVPAAELTPGAQAPSAITVSDDQVLVSGEPQQTAPERALYAEVRLSLGDEVYFEGFGLTARFDGGVLIDQEPEKPTTATGELRIIDGEYRAYGQGLVIESGRIYFAGGPVTEPALDVRAVRRPAEGILVGAHVQGTLQSPSFELFSEPPMTQQQQLSWLVLGRSLEASPEGEESALSRAALALGLKGGDFLAQNIGEQMGVDQIGIETGSGEAGAPSDPSQAALVVGKYLSPKLYVSYGIGLFNPESVLEMQYEISSNWKLITQSSGDGTGADILYTVEVGGN